MMKSVVFGSLLFALAVSSASVGRSLTISFEDVKTLKDNTTVLLIEVRQPIELVQTGEIPGSINIPLNIVETTLRDLSPEEFLELYGREKPKLDTPIVFTCQSGARSAVAQGIALALGFTDVRNFDGGWLLWVERINEEST